jgi:hypothetical protein
MTINSSELLKALPNQLAQFAATLQTEAQRSEDETFYTGVAADLGTLAAQLEGSLATDNAAETKRVIEETYQRFGRMHMAHWKEGRRMPADQFEPYDTLYDIVEVLRRFLTQ